MSIKTKKINLAIVILAEEMLNMTTEWEKNENGGVEFGNVLVMEPAIWARYCFGVGYFGDVKISFRFE